MYVFDPKRTGPTAQKEVPLAMEWGYPCPATAAGAQAQGRSPSRWFEHLNDGLPPQIARLKEQGSLAHAIELIDDMLAKGTLPELAEKLLVERYRMERLPRVYTHTREEALALVRAEWPEFTMEDLDRLIDGGRIDWRFIEGRQMLISDFVDSIRIYHDEVPGLAANPVANLEARDAMFDEMERTGRASRLITLRATLAADDPQLKDALTGAHVRCWLPLPRACELQSDICVLSSTPGVTVADESSLARTAYWEGEGLSSCEITYQYRIDAPWRDIDELARREAAVDEREIARALEAPELAAYLGERQPHIAFTPYLRSLAARIVAQAGASRPIEKARAIYDWITTNVDYRYQPPYALLDCIPQMTATGLRADCGVFALTFVTLCRIVGVPARWQSGLYVQPNEASGHDWAQFYSPEAGWLWADCSFGSAGRRTADARKRAHYFGNLDAWRMVANGDVFEPLCPPFDGMRDDPFDNQRGEMSVDGVGVASDALLRPVEVLEMKEV